MKRLLLVCGHNGGLFNEYYTSGKRSPDGKFREGEYVREFARILRDALRNRVETEILNPGVVGLSQRERVNWVNKIHSRTPLDLVLYLHTNAESNNGWSDATGTRLFHGTRAGAKTKRYHAALAERFNGPDWPLGYVAKPPRGWIVLNDTAPPALLLEIGFHTNRRNVEIMKNEIFSMTRTLADFLEEVIK